MTQPLTLFARFRARPGLERQLSASLEALVAPTREEPGCIEYVLHRSTEDPCVYQLYENWRSQADFDAHLAMPYLKAMLAESPAWLAEPLEIRFFERIR
ncbi:putative quinol monooxygenase [Gloeobacter morelensis]|uniref:Antibiotic biosynthesis monooxygenase n=1 Tax=Gloeobacter morelensis MG652769 TaxID=2781736 RepID=A0ABY3PH17_9CYAN|nr:putative quinol monooxygenase [Gloeobacter morelensis]UFP92966.1 antibiotic biosynthesis monooxygenase [Gloeobacter morelensis MG652769]